MKIKQILFPLLLINLICNNLQSSEAAKVAGNLSDHAKAGSIYIISTLSSGLSALSLLGWNESIEKKQTPNLFIGLFLTAGTCAPVTTHALTQKIQQTMFNPHLGTQAEYAGFATGYGFIAVDSYMYNKHLTDY